MKTLKRLLNWLFADLVLDLYEWAEYRFTLHDLPKERGKGRRIGIRAWIFVENNGNMAPVINNLGQVYEYYAIVDGLDLYFLQALTTEQRENIYNGLIGNA